MVDAVRLVVGQARGLAGEVRVIVRTLDDGGTAYRDRPGRAAPPTPRARSPIPGALAVIGTYELACSERALQVLRPAGLLLVSPLNAAGNLPGALRLAPTTGDQGTAAAQLAKALEATRVAIVSQRPRRRDGVRDRRSRPRRRRRHRSGRRSGRVRDAARRAHGRAARGRARPGRRAGRLAGPLGDRAAARDRARCRRRSAPAVVAPQAFDTLAFLDEAGAAADGVRVISRFVPAEQLGGDARSFAGAYADLHGQPPPVAIYAADAARAVLEAASARRRLARGDGERRCAALPAARRPARPLGRDAGGRHHAAAPRGARWSPAGRSARERVVSVAEPLPSSGEVK